MDSHEADALGSDLDAIRPHLASDGSAKRQSLVLLALLLALTVFQVTNLDTDPPPFQHLVQAGDEGYWIHNARALCLQGTLLPDDLCQALVGAPLYTALLAVAFKMLGVSLWSARLVSLLALVVLELTLVVLLRPHLRRRELLLFLLCLGTAHELLMYTKWATPLLPAVALQWLFVLLWTRGPARGLIGPVLSGAVLALSVLAHQVSLVVLPSAAVFVILSVALQRRSARAAAAAVLGFVAVVVGCIAFASDEVLTVFAEFWISHGQYRTDGTVAGVPRQIVAFVLSPGFFRYPSASLVLVLALSRMLALARRAIGQGPGVTASALCTPELYSLSMIVVTPLCLALVGELLTDRRSFLLLVPAAVIAVCGLHGSGGRDDNPIEEGNPHSSGVGLRRWAVAVPSVLLVLGSAYYVRAATSTLRMWFLSVDLNLLAAAVSAASVVVGGAFAWVVLFSRRSVASTASAVMILVVSAALNAVWYCGGTTTIRDASRSIGRAAAEGEHLLGAFSHWLAIESNTHPIWYNPDWHRGINESYLSRSCGRELLLIEATAPDPDHGSAVHQDRRRRVNDRLRSMNLECGDVPDRPVVEVLRLRLCPYPFSDTYRFEGTVYRVLTAAPVGQAR